MIQLFEHNETAYSAAVSMLHETGKAAIIHPTGTGKSFIGFKLCEDNPEKKFLWLSPSEYIFKTQLEALKKASGYVPANIKFFTYAKLMNLSEAEILNIKPDFIILDEFHRCGAARWQDGIQRLLNSYPDAPVLGLSATNVRYLDNQRDMADELFDGCIASEMTLGEAIVRGILNPPKYVLSIYSYQKDLEKYERRVKLAKNKAVRDVAERYLEALRRALEKAEGLDVVFKKHMDDPRGKYIVFCANAEHMRQMMAESKTWFEHIDQNYHVYSVYSDDPEASQSFADFKADDSDHLRLLFCIDALNEGIHVDGVSGVILLRPTVSPIIYKQQIGRALSASSTKNPVIFDIVNNFESLYSIGMIEQEMRAAITYYNYFGDGEIVTDKFQIFDEVEDCRRLFGELEEALSASWETMYACAKGYFATFGNLDVPTKYKTSDGYSLGGWLQTQRLVRAGKANGRLTDSQIEQLDKIGMRWESVNDVSWQRHYDACRAYRDEHGDLNVSGDCVVNGIALGKWIKSVRNYRRYGIKSNYFTPEREKMLDDLGMIWDQPDYLWSRNYEAAKRYFAQFGNLNVPAGHVENGVKLYNWLADLRKKYRAGVLTNEQIEQMNALGMRWQSKNDIAWENGFNHAKAYADKHGSADASLNYVCEDGYKLGVWLSKCREKYTKGSLTDSQIKQLEDIKIVWNKSRKNDWDECFEKASTYYKEHGNLNVPPSYIADGVWLNKWLNEQKLILQGKRKGKTLTEAQKSKLASIGLTADEPRDIKWQKRYAELKHYYDTHGNSKIPTDYTDSSGQNLYIWLTNQKVSAKAGKLSDRRKNLLREVGALNG